MSSKPTVVIIGGSFSGVGVAHGVLKADKAKVVMINPLKQAYFNIAAPRILAKPDAFKPEQYLITIEKSFAKYPKGSFELIQDLAGSIDPAAKTVTLKNAGTAVSYDYLVIASGGTTPSSIGRGSTVAPFKSTNGDDLEAVIKASQQEIAEAKTVLVAGGGAVGVEFAGELAEAFKNKEGAKVTLLTQTKYLLPTLREKAGLAAESILTNNNVKVLTSRKVQKAEQDSETKKWTATLDNGETILADLYISTTGILPNNEFIPAEFLNANGWVEVNSHFRVKNGSDHNIYAVGDITAYPQRMAMKVSEQVPIVVANISADILGTGKRQEYTPKDAVMMVVPVGAAKGTGQLFFGWVPPSFLVVMAKGKDYFVSKAASMY